MRLCRGSLLVCEGLSSLVGLGDRCHVEQAECNHGGCPRDGEGLLAEVVAIDKSRVHLLPFERLEAIGIGARVVVARDRDRIRPTEGWLGRVLDAFGDPWIAGRPCRSGRCPTG